MAFIRSTVFFLFIIVSINALIDDAISNSSVPDNFSPDNSKFQVNTLEKVEIRLYYECMCPYSRNFLLNQIREVIAKLNEFLIINTYPYGNAKTIIDNGRVKFVCQHGPNECYGNKLHACAIDTFPNKTEAILYNACMTDYSHSEKGSDDKAADKCGEEMNLDSNPIKQCAQSSRGDELLKYYGEESKKANFKHVPYVLINGKKAYKRQFLKEVCAALHNTPKACEQYV